MKKLIFAIFSTFMIGASSSAIAATTWGGSTSGSTNTDEVLTTECTLLSETVDLTVSKNVVGGWACDEGNNIIQVAACHEGGTRKEVSCSTYSASNLIDGCSDTSGVGTPDYLAFFASSAGGVMQDKQLGARCTTTSLGNLSDWAN